MSSDQNPNDSSPGKKVPYERGSNKKSRNYWSVFLTDWLENN